MCGPADKPCILMTAMLREGRREEEAVKSGTELRGLRGGESKMGSVSCVLRLKAQGA